MTNNFDIDFDWRKIVKQNMPGKASPEQLKKAEIVSHVIGDLTIWAVKYDLMPDRVEPSAFGAVVGLPVSTNYKKILLLAKYMLWIFDFDAYIDKIDYSKISTDMDAKLEYLDTQINFILKSVDEISSLESEKLTPTQRNLSWLTSSQKEDVVIPVKSCRLQQALCEIWYDLRTSLEENIATNSITNISDGIILMIAAMRSELEVSFNYHQNNILPTIKQYMEYANLSIAIPALCVFVAGLCDIDCRAEKNYDNAITKVASAVRLANDIGNYSQELEEGKVNSITLALAQLGFAPMQPKDTEIAQAKGLILTQYLEVATSEFRGLVPELPGESSLSHFLYYTLAFALARYEKGNYVTLD